MTSEPGSPSNRATTLPPPESTAALQTSFVLPHPADEWQSLLPKAAAARTDFLIEVAQHLNLRRHTKAVRGPQKAAASKNTIQKRNPRRSPEDTGRTKLKIY
jgi:hypothetical protein